MSTFAGGARRVLGALMVAGLLTVPTFGAAQEDPWSGRVELGLSLFFGSTDQTTFTTRGGVERADSLLEVSSGASFSYGEATDDTGDTFVNKRSWNLAAGLDYRPYAVVTPFFFATLESSFEKRIDTRFSGGVGGKYTFLRDPGGRLDLSLALLWERTDPRVVPGVSSDVTSLYRGSTRLRYRRPLADGRATFESVTFYRPELGRVGNYTIDSENSLSLGLTSAASFKITFIDRYDSRATARGAPSNNDGQVVVSLATTF